MTEDVNTARLATEEEKRELIAAFDEMVNEMGIDFAKGLEILQTIGIGPTNLPTQLADPSIRSAFMLEKLLADKAATSKEVKQFTAVFQEIPRGFFKRALRETLKEMPRIPGGGRPRLIKTDQEKSKLREEVLQLIGSGTRTGDALRRIAQRHGISYRQMQRIWSQRKNQ